MGLGKLQAIGSTALLLFMPMLHARTSTAMGTVKGTYENVGGALVPGNPNPRHPASGTVTATGTAGRFTARVDSADGSFTLRLPPGKYRLTGWDTKVHTVYSGVVGHGSKTSKGTVCGQVEISVHAGQHLKTVLKCAIP